MKNLNDLTLRDIAEIEELSGQPFGAMGDGAMPKGKLLTSIVYVLKRKDNPEFSFEDAGNMTMADLNEVFDPNSSRKG